MTNGELLTQAEQEFDLLITTDKNLRHQQDLGRRRLAILVLPTTSWPEIQQHATEIAAAVENTKPGDYLDLTW